MKKIYYNSSVAQSCGRNGIIKAVLINYIYNYHKSNPSKGAGAPAPISLAEFVYQYKHGDRQLWSRAFIHRILTDLAEDEHISITKGDDSRNIYQVSQNVGLDLNDGKKTVIGFDLGLAVEFGLYKAIVERHLRHIVKKSPKNIAYGLSVKEIAEKSCISPAEVYRVVKELKVEGILASADKPVKRSAPGLALTKGNAF